MVDLRELWYTYMDLDLVSTICETDYILCRVRRGRGAEGTLLSPSPGLKDNQEESEKYNLKFFFTKFNPDPILNVPDILYNTVSNSVVETEPVKMNRLRAVTVRLRG